MHVRKSIIHSVQRRKGHRFDRKKEPCKVRRFSLSSSLFLLRKVRLYKIIVMQLQSWRVLDHSELPSFSISYSTLIIVVCSSGFVRGRQLSTSILMEIARMMQTTTVKEVNKCEAGCCVEIEENNGMTTHKLIGLGESIPVKKENPCDRVFCTVRYV